MRPKIKVPLKPVDIFLEAVCIAVFIALCAYLIFIWNKLPNIVPTHFGISGAYIIMQLRLLKKMQKSSTHMLLK